MTDTKFPDTFLWGAATAAYQVAGGITNNDWNFFTTHPTIVDRVHSLGTASRDQADYFYHTHFLDAAISGRVLPRAPWWGMEGRGQYPIYAVFQLFHFPFQWKGVSPL
jgi:hypothetical protein